MKNHKAANIDRNVACFGRDEEIRRFLHLFDEAQGGSGAFVLVTGGPGMGKSTLLADVQDRFLDLGGLVLEANCRPGLPSYLPLVEVARAALGHLYGLEVDRHCLARWEDMLRFLEGHGPAPSRGVSPDAQRIQYFDQFASMIRKLSKSRATVILVHDLGFADPGTLDLVRFLGRVLTSRPEFATAPFNGLLLVCARDAAVLSPDERWADDANLVQMNLNALDSQGVQQFLSSPAVVRRVMKHTNGVPRLLDDMLLEGPPAARSSSPLSQVDAAAGHLMSVLAVVGRPLGLDDLRVLSGLPQERLSRAIARLAGRHLIVKKVIDGEIRVGFARAGDQDAVYQQMNPQARQDLHVKIGEFLRPRGQEELEACADHLLRGQVGSRAVRMALEAGQRLEIACCFSRAADFYQRALQQVEDEDLGLELTERLSNLLELTGQTSEALECAEQLRLRSPDDPEVPLRIAHLHILNNDVSAAKAELARLKQRSLDDEGSNKGTMARVLARTVEACLLEGQTHEALQAVNEGLRLCQDEAGEHSNRGGCDLVRLQLQDAQGKIHLIGEEYRAAEDIFLDNLDLARAQGRAPQELRALVQLGETQLKLGNYREAGQWYDEAVTLARRLGEHRLLGVCFQHLGVLAERRRDYRAALESYQEAVGAWKKVGLRSYLAWVAIDLGKLYLELGDVSRAQALVELSEKLTDGEPPLGARFNLELLRGHIARRECRFKEAADRFSRAREMAHEGGHLERLARGLMGQAELHLDRGDPQRALRLLEDDASLPGGASLRLQALLLRCRAELEMEEKTPLSGVQDRLAEALDLSEELGDAEGGWQARLLLGLLALRSGRKADAQRWFKEAAAGEEAVRKNIPRDFWDLRAEQPLQRLLRRQQDACASGSPGGIAVNEGPRKEGRRKRYSNIVGRHPLLLQVLDNIDRVAPTDTTVLIRGESGTGKELVARAIHRQSQRSRKKMVTVNCGALVESLLLSELFGHERGAFTGASHRKKGRFELAEEGTIFLDEIGDISPRTQAALLRVLQEREFQRVGGTESIHVNVRIICATNRDLEEMVARGEFREDLYYRLRGVQLSLPPLRKRLGDIPLLARHFLGQIAAERGSEPRTISEDGERLLRLGRWAGNIRQLENVLRSVSLLSDSTVLDVEDFMEYPELVDVASKLRRGLPAGQVESQDGQQPGDAYSQVRTQGLTLKQYKTRVEVECISAALAESGGNITKAAKLLGMKRPRLSQLIKEHKIVVDASRTARQSKATRSVDPRGGE